MRKYWKILNNFLLKQGFWLLLSLLFACAPAGNTGSGDVLVRVYDKYLYASDLTGLVPPGTSVRDSLTMVRTFIQNWVDKELIAHKAEQNLPAELKDFSLQLEEYRNSLIIFEYEKMLVKQELDTIVTLVEMTDYYEQNIGSFILREDILSMKYLILHTDSPEMPRLRQYMRADEAADNDSLIQYASRYAVTLNLMEERWINLDEMREIVPLKTYSYNDFLAMRRIYELRDSVYVYMINVRDYRPAESHSPFEMVKEKIRKIIINRRKNELIKNMRQTVLQDAIEDNQVEIF